MRRPESLDPEHFEVDVGYRDPVAVDSPVEPLGAEPEPELTPTSVQQERWLVALGRWSGG